MRIIKNNLDKENIINKVVPSYPRKHICDNCLSELEYDEDDLYMGFGGCMHIKCPICECENMIEDNEQNIVLTKDNILFPVHFYHFSKEVGSVDNCNIDTVRNNVKRAIEYFRLNKDEFAWVSMCGNLLVVVFRYSMDNEYSVFVSNDFYDVDIDFETEDYSRREIK